MASCYLYGDNDVSRVTAGQRAHGGWAVVGYLCSDVCIVWQLVDALLTKCPNIRIHAHFAINGLALSHLAGLFNRSNLGRNGRCDYTNVRPHI